MKKKFQVYSQFAFRLTCDSDVELSEAGIQKEKEKEELQKKSALMDNEEEEQ